MDLRRLQTHVDVVVFSSRGRCEGEPISDNTIWILYLHRPPGGIDYILCKVVHALINIDIAPGIYDDLERGKLRIPSGGHIHGLRVRVINCRGHVIGCNEIGGGDRGRGARRWLPNLWLVVAEICIAVHSQDVHEQKQFRQ